MSLTFLTPLMLAGAMLVAAPIILHLVMRQQPKHLIFPALRFIRQRNDANKRRLKLRHIVLLALRCAAIAFLALALARPSVQSAGFLGDQEAPVAGAMVFDSSPRMQYRNENQTRLEVAQQVAQRLLKQLPRESDVVVLDSRSPTGAFSIDAAAASQRIDRLAFSGASQSLSDLCLEAIRLVGENPKSRKEVYVFTDLGRAAWSAESAARLRDKLVEKKDVALYVIDVGVENPQNVGLADIRLSSDALAKNTPLRLETDLSAIGTPEEERSVALEILDSKRQPQRRDQTSVHLSPGQSQPIDFQLSGLELGTHQGFVRVIGEDGFAADNARYFTIEVRPAWKVLIVAAKSDQHNAATLAESLAPSAWRRTGQVRFECEIVTDEQLAAKSLDDYTVVCLVDPPPLASQTWASLARFVDHGGGLGIWLGPSAQPQGRGVDAFNTADAQKLMPGELARVWRRQDAFLAPSDYQHPLLAKFRTMTGGIPWQDFPVASHWQLTNMADGVNTIIPFNNGQPALLERSVGKGRVLVFTTPIADDATQADLWNTLVVGSGSWPFFMLTNEMMLYLAASGDERLNYSAGETVVIRLPESQRQLTYSLRSPDGETSTPAVDQKTGTITISTTAAAGNYSLESGGTESGVRRGFSVNISAADTDLTRLSSEDFTALLGKGRFRLSRGQKEIERDVNLGRAGHELYPLLIVIVAIVLGLEYLVANKFYRRDPQADQAPRHVASLPPAEEARKEEALAAT
jgi:hypothetical protein